MGPIAHSAVHVKQSDMTDVIKCQKRAPADHGEHDDSLHIGTPDGSTSALRAVSVHPGA